MQRDLTSFRAEHWLYLFLAIHLFCWTLAPALIRYNLPLDAIEGTIWGQHLQWGYDKNPFLNGWLTALATHFSHESGWTIYLFSQLSVVICFWAVWQLAKILLPPIYALISVMILEGAQYYNFHAIDFNDNTLELSTWALTIYYFYRALQTQKNTAWIFTGIFAGLALMAKYYTIVLLGSMLLFLLLHTETRRQLKTLPPYIGILTFAGLIAPHFVWLFNHDFITLKYVQLRAYTPPDWKNHFIFPISFIWQQVQVFLPAFLLLSLFLLGKKSSEKKSISVSAFDLSFLHWMCFAPMLLTACISLLFGTVLRAGYGMPLLSFWGVLLLVTMQPQITLHKLHRWLIGFFTLLSLTVFFYFISLTDSNDASTANFPGQEIAQFTTRLWRDTYHTPLKYVAGSRWIGGNIGFYSPDHPTVFVEWKEEHSPWINTQDLAQQGAMFVWGITDNEILPDEIKMKFPQLTKEDVLVFSFKRNTKNINPIKIGIAFLPPKKLMT